MAQSDSDDLTPTGRVSLAEGLEFSHYKLIDRIGAGSMGVVYLAEDTQLRRKVALKFLPEQYLDDDTYKRRFLEEAQSAAIFDHPHIITVHEASEFAGRPFIAMQYLSGSSLAEVISNQEISLLEAVNLAGQVVSGLECAHGRGLTHRDVKPSNILVDCNGRIKLVDFGLATVKGAEYSTGSDPGGGTPSYMSPEQARGESVDARSDLFSVGVLLYEMITGRRPFDRGSVLATVQAIMNSEPDPLERFRADVPEDLQRIVTKLLQKNPDMRYQHASDLLVDLRASRGMLGGQRPARPVQSDSHDRSIAVLPFANLSNDRDQDYFCEGVAEEIINALTQIRGLRVVARSSSFVFRDHRTDIRDIGNRLNVHSVLEGSVRKAGESLRVTVQLIEVATGYHLWSERFDRNLEDIFAIQDEIAANVARAMQLYMSDAERVAVSRIPTSNVKAYDYYLQGRQYFHRQRKKSMHFAIDLFKRALDLDGNFALAWATLANCCSALLHYYSESSVDLHEMCDKASLKALELAPQSSEAHAARGFALSVVGQLSAARQEFETALAIDPNQSDARYYYGRVLFQQGAFADAIRHFEFACEIAENHEARFFAGQSYEALKRHAEAKTNYYKALVAVDKHLELNPDDARAMTIKAVSLFRTENREDGLVWAGNALDADSEDAGVQYNVACLFALENESDRALEALQKALAAGFGNFEWFQKDPDLDSIRDDPRFKVLFQSRWPSSN